MANSDLRLDEIGYWSEVKLEIVRKYAAAYSRILGSQSFVKGHVYIDAFAGAGSHVSDGSQRRERRFAHRIDHLRQTSAMVRFLSIEPLLGPLPALDLRGIHWAIVGGESRPRAWPMKAEWVLEIRDQCQAAGTAFFFKQWGGVFKGRTGRQLDGKNLG